MGINAAGTLKRMIFLGKRFRSKAFSTARPPRGILGDAG
jgi:hypothetical protein